MLPVLSPTSTTRIYFELTELRPRMRNRKSSFRKKANVKRAGTPSSTTEHIEAKRQYLKRQRLRRNGSVLQEERAATASEHSGPVRLENARVVAAETHALVLGDGKYVEERRVSVTSAPAQSPCEGSASPVHGDDNHILHQTVRIPHDIALAIEFSRQDTTFYPHYSELLASWATTRGDGQPSWKSTIIEFTTKGILTAARRLIRTTRSLRMQSVSNPDSTTLALLSAASPKKPCGNFLKGTDAPESVVARHSSLIASLTAPAAEQFYQEHRKFLKEDGSGLHDHSMVYSPGVVVFRREADDELSPDPEDKASRTPLMHKGKGGGEFIPPYLVNVISCVPVNAAAVHTKHVILPTEEKLFEDGIRSAMKERMARVLRLFEERGDRVLVLGAFGCGPQSQNNVEMIAGVWAELLVCGDLEGQGGTSRPARFKGCFEKVMFAVPGKLHRPFKQAYEMRVFEAQVANAAMSNK